MTQRFIFIPPLDTVVKLLRDVPIRRTLLTDYDSEIGPSMFPDVPLTAHQWLKHHHPKHTGAWSQAMRDDHDAYIKGKIGTPVFPAGTVFVFDRYHVSHSGTEQITVRLLASPDPRLTPRKAGGTLKGKGRLYLTVKDLNTFGEVEILKE